MIRTPFRHVPSRRRPKASLPILLVAGLRAAPEDFERLAKDFDLMLDRVVIANARDSLTQVTPVGQT